jgi:histidinol-phosphate aminotransferase
MPKPTDIIARLTPYDPGHDLPALRARWPAGALIELGSNENSLGPSPQVAAALRDVPLAEIYRYPDPSCGALRAKLADALGVDRECIVLGNGSHELLILLAQCYAGPGDEIVFSEFGFAVFPIATAAVGATPVVAKALPRDHAMPRGHDLDALAAKAGPRTKLVYVANPNNPTGTWFERDALAAFVAKIPPHVLVVVDEAYHEYVAADVVGTGIELLAQHPNVVVTRTFSKGYGLAGLRVGYVVAAPDVVDTVNRLRESFNVNAIAQLAALAALGDPAHVAQSREQTAAEVARVTERLRAKGLFVHPSRTNFVLIDFDVPVADVEARLFAQGVVLRPMGGYGLPTCLRATVGTRAENDRLLEALGA